MSTQLTANQNYCLSRACEGVRHDAISEELGVARSTVTTHLLRARRKLGARTLLQAVALFVRSEREAEWPFEWEPISDKDPAPR